MTTSNRDTFAISLPSEREILITRWFRAPRSLLFDVITNPDHVGQWWGPRALSLVNCEMDVRPGGRYRFVLRTPEGVEAAFRGEYLEIRRPERVVSTFEFEGMPGHGSIETLTLDEIDGQTRLTVRCLYQSREDRDGHLNSGMEPGVRESHERLEELLDTLA